MTPLDRYLSEYFLDFDQLAAASGLSQRQLRQLLAERLIPAASYVVASDTVTSYVFGTLPAPGATPGEYFHPAVLVWIARAEQVIAQVGRAPAHAALQARFVTNMRRALADMNTAIWPLRDAFADDGSMLDGLHARIESLWEHFLHGTFGLCVANPVSEADIAHKEVLQEKLTALSADGAKREYAETETRALLELIAAYEAAAMPFSPIEYPLSSRKRLADDLKARLEGSANSSTEAASPLPAACGWS